MVISGVAGFVGYHLANYLLEKGHYVYGIDCMSYCSRRESIEDLSRFSSFKFIKDNIVNIKELPECDVVINCAAHTHVDRSLFSTQEFLESNINGVTHLLDLIKQLPLYKRPLFFHFSTDEVLGDNPPDDGFKEDSIYCPSSPYAASKAAAEMMILAYHRTFGINYIILRPTNMYGLYQFPEKLIPYNLRCLDRGQKCIMYGEGNYQRYWLHVSDCAIAVEKLLEGGMYRKSIVNQTFHLSGNIVLHNIDVIKTLVRLYYEPECVSFEDYIERVPNRLGEDKLYHVNDDKLTTLLGWKPETNFSTALEEIINENIGSIRWQM